MSSKKPEFNFQFSFIPLILLAGLLVWYVVTYQKPADSTETSAVDLPVHGLVEGERPHAPVHPETTKAADASPPRAPASAAERAKSTREAISHRTTALAEIDMNDDFKASFSIKVRDLVSPYQVLGLFVMPGEKVDLEAIFTRPTRQYAIEAPAGKLERSAEQEWFWTAPEAPGVYNIKIKGPIDAIQINAFVKTVFDNDRDDILNGYRIGAYQKKPLRQNPRFVPPEGLIEVNEQTADVRVSPHFTLDAFSSHQPGDPKYLHLDERLILKLEMLLEEVRQAGIEATTFTVMSGFRTPWYNRQIGNTTSYSLHLYGSAADIFIDEDQDGRMDDLNGDGQTNRADARLLYDIADKMDRQSWYQPFLGGLGLYGPKPHRGPFVHVDVRGYNARW